MPTVLNCLDEEKVIKVGGIFYTFKPGQMKFFHNNNIARALTRIYGEQGFVGVPEHLDHLSHLNEANFDKIVTAEEKEEIAKLKEQGIEQYCKNLRRLIFNATVSVQKDIDISGAKYDARIEATDADIKRLEDLAKYQKSKSDSDQRRIDRMKELEKTVGPVLKGN